WRRTPVTGTSSCSRGCRSTRSCTGARGSSDAMRIWPALLVAPLLALLDQAIAYATAGWECARQGTLAMQGVHALFLAATLTCTFIAWQRCREDRTAAIRGSPAEVHRYLAGVASASCA